MNPTNYLVLSAILFAIGAGGVLVRRNAIIAFMGVELMLNASNLSLITFARMHGDVTGQVMAFFVMVVAAAAGFEIACDSEPDCNPLEELITGYAGFAENRPSLASVWMTVRKASIT